MPSYCVVLFYKYCPLSDETLSQLFEAITVFTDSHEIKGRILIAEEGINGTIAGSDSNVKEFVHFISTLEFCNLNSIDWKYSYGEGCLPFVDMYIKEASELISTGDAKKLIQQHTYFEPNKFGGMGGTGKHLNPKEFHDALEDDPNAVVLDIRNDFEYDIGHFEGAVSMNTNTFSETWRALDIITAEQSQRCSECNDTSGEEHILPTKTASKRNYYMYCTGGIRCEKASVYLKAKGFENVFQLQGGIHRYLEEFPGADKKFLGRNFVFDSRMIEKEDRHSSTAVEVQKSQADSIANDSATVNDGDVLGRCVECDCPHDAYTSDQRCAVCRQPLLMCPSCKSTQSTTDYSERLVPQVAFRKDLHCKKHRYLKDIYFKNLTVFTSNALHGQVSALRALERDEAFLGKEHKKRRKTIRNQIDKINEELTQRITLEHDAESVVDVVSNSTVSGCDATATATASGSLMDCTSGADSKIKVVGGIWGT